MKSESQAVIFTRAGIRKERMTMLALPNSRFPKMAVSIRS